MEIMFLNKYIELFFLGTKNINDSLKKNEKM